MIRLHDVDRWNVVKPGSFLRMGVPETPMRTIRLELNSPSRTEVTAVFDNDGQPKELFICTLDGFERVEFSGAGVVTMFFAGKGPVWYYTDEGLSMAVPASQGAKSFTKIMNRRARNLELEMMMFKMEQNINRRIANLTREYEERINNLSVDEFDDETGEQGRRAETGSGVEEVGGEADNAANAAASAAAVREQEPVE